MSFQLEADNYDEIYALFLDKCLNEPDCLPVSRGEKCYELIDSSFVIKNPRENVVSSKKRKFNIEFAQRFYDWIIGGKYDVGELFDINPNAKKYADGNEGRNTSYGPRIKDQLEIGILDELERDPGSRRAVINILYPEDKEILEPLSLGQIEIEFPCTMTQAFLIRGNKLNTYISMRSNNIVKTICYDVYNFTNLQIHVFEKLKERGLDNLSLGNYHHHMVSGHFFESEKPLVEKILEEYKERNLWIKQ